MTRLGFLPVHNQQTNFMLAHTVNSEIFARVLSLPISLCHLLMYVSHALVANYDIANMSFNAIRENKILAKNSEITVIAGSILTLIQPLFISQV